MKKLFSVIISLMIANMILAQSTATFVVLTKGQKISVKNDVTIDADFGMGMLLNSTSVSINALQVKDSSTNSYTISNSLTKLKANMNMMGQNNSYDSDNKSGNNEDMARIFDEKMNKITDVVIDKNTGMAIAKKQEESKTDEDTANVSENMMKIFSNSSDEGVVDGAFEILPAGKKTGDTWADTSNSKESKSIRTYTLQLINGNDAVVKMEMTIKAKNKLDFQGMEFEITTDTKTTGQIIFDINTGLVKNRNSESDITGSFQMMGQDMPITAKTTSKTEYN
ncbi:MAG TPA: DUF6263 family protein [Ferruginibacter sp.]|nr:DUF6263 family protein [Ferruginibacter sp.]